MNSSRRRLLALAQLAAHRSPPRCRGPRRMHAPSRANRRHPERREPAGEPLPLPLLERQPGLLGRVVLHERQLLLGDRRVVLRAERHRALQPVVVLHGVEPASGACR